MIIQGFTSAGKSFLSTVASKINKRECLSTALSEHTTIEDLLGRDIIKSDSSIKFIPGILLLAYKDGKTLPYLTDFRPPRHFSPPFSVLQIPFHKSQKNTRYLP